jgi:hypothetical protein
MEFGQRSVIEIIQNYSIIALKFGNLYRVRATKLALQKVLGFFPPICFFPHI